MIIYLAKELGSIDNDLSIKVNVRDNLYTLSVESDDIGTLYSFTSTSLEEAYSKVLSYRDCLLDVDKFEKLLDEVTNTPLEV